MHTGGTTKVYLGAVLKALHDNTARDYDEIVESINKTLSSVNKGRNAHHIAPHPLLDKESLNKKYMGLEPITREEVRAFTKYYSDEKFGISPIIKNIFRRNFILDAKPEPVTQLTIQQNILRMISGAIDGDGKVLNPNEMSNITRGKPVNYTYAIVGKHTFDDKTFTSLISGLLETTFARTVNEVLDKNPKIVFKSPSDAFEHALNDPNITISKLFKNMTSSFTLNLSAPQFAKKAGFSSSSVGKIFSDNEQAQNTSLNVLEKLIHSAYDLAGDRAPKPPIEQIIVILGHSHDVSYKKLSNYWRDHVKEQRKDSSNHLGM